MPHSITQHRLAGSAQLHLQNRHGPSWAQLATWITCESAVEHEQITVIAPATNRPFATIPACTPADVEPALTRARRAQSRWATQPVQRRKEILLRFHDMILQRQAVLLDVLQMETGKARRDALEEILDVAVTARHYALRTKSYLRPRRRKGALPLLTRTVELRHPVGVVGFISPWNYPLTLTLADAIPAISAGNAVIVMPDSRAPFSALLGMQWLREAGLPADVFQVLTGDGATIGPPLIAGVDYLSFTGSTATGRIVARQAGERLIGCSLELGGKNPMLVLNDADLKKAVEGAVRGCFANAGQLCLSFERLYIQRDVYDRFVSAFVARTQALRLGAEMDFAVEMGSLISSEQLSKVDAHVQDALSKGAELLAGGRPRPDLGPFFYEPTILAGVTPDMPAAREETFGPVVAVYPFTDLDAAVAMANGSVYGLNAGIWSRNTALALQLAARLKCGTVNINEAYAAAWASVDAPMGGMKASGIGRRHGDEGLLKYTESQTVAAQKFLSIGPRPFARASLYARGMTLALRLLRHLPGLR